MAEGDVHNAQRVAIIIVLTHIGLESRIVECLVLQGHSLNDIRLIVVTATIHSEVEGIIPPIVHGNKVETHPHPLVTRQAVERLGYGAVVSKLSATENCFIERSAGGEVIQEC